ncbi:MAG: NtrZ family periplasmic regulatory protein [Parcubacteria group bacterium]
MAQGRILAGMAALVLFGTAGAAHAANAPANSAAPAAAEAFTVRGDFNAQAAAAQPNKILQWDTKKGRWGLKLDLAGRDAQWKDVDVGAFFRVTPSLRVGGAVGLESTQDTPVQERNKTQQAAPKVRLETAFKF